MIHISAQYENNDADFQLICNLVLSEMQRVNVPGVAVGLLRDGREYLAGFGVTSVENPLPVTADTLFQIGSTTKTITATIVMQLGEKGLIDLDEPIRTYLPKLKLRDQSAERTVTMRHLLTHQGGWPGDYFRDTGNGDDALSRYVIEMATLPQEVPVGTLWAYNNAGFGLAGRIIELITKQTYEEVAQELILDPLGMSNSFFFPADVISRRFVVGHRFDEDEGVIVERPWALARSAHSVGGLCSSARDQLRYARFSLGDGRTTGGQRLLEPATMRAMQTPQCPANYGRQQGLGWRLQDYGDAWAVLHGGATNGQESAFLMIPTRNFAITILTNAEEGTLLNETVVARALDHYLNLRQPLTTPVELSAEAMREYEGTYEAQMTRLDLYQSEGKMMLQVTPKGGFPDVDSPPPPPPPPVRMAFIGPDLAMALDEPLNNLKAEFLREDGRIVWLRTSRLHRRIN